MKIKKKSHTKQSEKSIGIGDLISSSFCIKYTLHVLK